MLPSYLAQTYSPCSALAGLARSLATLARVARILLRVCLAPRDGSIRYADFLRELEDGADEDEMRHQSPLGGPSPSRKYNGGGRCRGTSVSTSERGRLEASLRRAIERGIDYRREMELEEEGAGGGRKTGVKEGVVSRQRRVQ